MTVLSKIAQQVIAHDCTIGIATSHATLTNIRYWPSIIGRASRYASAHLKRCRRRPTTTLEEEKHLGQLT